MQSIRLNGCPQSVVPLFLPGRPSPSTDSSYLAVNSSKVSSACASLFRTADCEKVRWAFNATGVARWAGTRTPTRLTFDAARTKDMVRFN